AERLSKEAELFKLRQQLAPHFLFNSLNSISALVTSQPEQARKMIQQLSDFLRGNLKKEEQQWVLLSEEFQYLELYLDIEKVRFGHRLTTVIDHDLPSLDMRLPSMLLQPIVENCLKHGLAPKIEGGRIQLRTMYRDGRLHIEIEDNGVGISEEKMPQVYVEGIGLSNVRERLRVLYGADFNLEIESRPGEGTLIRIDIPELVSTMQVVG
ncbi:MAG: histidine kinase, partial [Acidobacteriota bacterium]|nr:histidine kinase [Acidobacteriota bacterium]